MKVNSVIVRRGMTKLAWLVLVATGFLFQESARANGFFETFKATVTIQESPPSISFAWTFQPYMEGTLKRRALPSVGSSVTESWQKMKTIPMGATTITDTTAMVGVAYEYAIEFSGYRYAYVASGIRLPLEESRGKILLMVDQTMVTPCAAELDRLQQDLVGDGWQVIRHNVPRDDGNYSTRHQAKSVKATIVADYQADPANVKAVLLFGHVPVPYSGWDIPDGHEFRTLNADAYYGDMTGVWTDNTVSNISVSTGIRGSNIPGDGKFDQNVIPANVELMVGRVDLYKMPAFKETETTLLKRYLAKDHAWRNRRFTVQPIGMVNWGRGWNWGPYNTVRQLTDNEYTFGDGGLWNVNGRSIKNSYGFDFQRMLNRQSCLHAYTGNTGGWTMAGMVSTADMAAGNILAVFMTEGGSWSVEWDYQDSLMRSFLAASGYSLCGAWSEFPGTYLHHMAAGRPLGLSMRVWQNATWSDYVEDWSCMRAVYLALQGDPTVRLHNVAPPSQLTAAPSSGNVLLNWTASADSNVVGYHIYRANGMTSPFVRLNSDTPVAGTNYTDSTARSTNVVYMVRAVKLEQSVSASYWNMSQGAFVPFRLDGSSNRLPTANGQTLQVPEASWVKINLTGSDPDGDPLTYVINEMPINGQITGGPVNFVYTPYLRDEIRPNANGPDRLTFTVHDAWGASAPAVVNLMIVPDSKRIVTSLDNLGVYFRVPEGGTAPFQVKLAAQPASNTVVTVARTSGNIKVQSGASLTFTTNNWNIDQTVTLDYVDSIPNDDSAQAFITCSAPGLNTNTFRILEYDNDSTLEVSTTVGGTVNLLGTNLVTTGAAIPISATASNGFAFLYWTCTFGDTTIANLYAPTTTVTVAETSLQQLAQIKAVFLDNKALVTSLSQVSIPEGGTNTFQVRLASQPASNTVVTLTSEYYSDVDITFQSGATLTFTPGNWNTWQTVTLAAVQDIDQFNGYAWITCSATGWNNGYVTAYEEDNDAYLTMVAGDGGSVVPSGILMATMGVATNISAVADAGYIFANWTVTSGQATVGDGTTANTSVTIGGQAAVQANFISSALMLRSTANEVGVAEGGTETFQVKLAVQPASNMVVTVVRTDGDTDINVMAGDSLTFTPGNWDSWQTVTLEASLDADTADGIATITCSAPGQSNVVVTVTEQDSEATLTVLAGAGGTTVPSGAITVPKGQSTNIAAMANTGYSFANWTVTNGTAEIDNATAVDTFVVITNAATIQARFALNAVAIQRSVTATNVPEGGTTAFQLRLSAQPTGTVTVAVVRTGGDTNITIQSGASLIFTTNNWATNQTVTLAASQDADTLNGSATIMCSATGRVSVAVIATELEDDATLTVVAGGGGSTVPNGSVVVTQGVAVAIHAVANSGYGFTNWTVTSGSAMIADSHAADTTVSITNAATVRAQFFAQGLALLTSASFVSVPEGGTARFQVGLTEAPVSNVTVSVVRSAGDTDLAVQAGSNLVFTTANWSQWQSVTLAAAADVDTVKGSATITCSAVGLANVVVTVSELENGTASVDTDGDGVSDAREVEMGRNPLVRETGSVLPFVERFEADTVTPGELTGQHGWVASLVGAAQVLADDVAEGAQALRIDSTTSVAAVSQAFTGTLQTVWLDLRQKVSPMAMPASVPNAALALIFNSAGQLVVCDGARPAGSEWTVLTNHPAQTTGTWVRISARLDYAKQTWDLYLDGSCVASALGFAAPKQRFASLTFEGKSGAVDDLNAGYALPAGITIPDSWYLEHFGNLSYGDEDDPDGDHLTNREEYLAGTNPNDPASHLALDGVERDPALADSFIVRWQSATGRFYTVQAATNLGTGFTFDLRNNIPATPPVNVHTDAVNGLEQKFYRVKVE